LTIILLSIITELDRFRPTRALFQRLTNRQPCVKEHPMPNIKVLHFKATTTILMQTLADQSQLCHQMMTLIQVVHACSEVELELVHFHHPGAMY